MIYLIENDLYDKAWVRDKEPDIGVEPQRDSRGRIVRQTEWIVVACSIKTRGPYQHDLT